MGGEDGVADVHLATLEPLTIDVVVDPPDDTALHDDASDWRGRRHFRPEPSADLLVPTSNEKLPVICGWWANRDDAIGKRRERNHAQTIARRDTTSRTSSIDLQQRVTVIDDGD
jgi:hypothetical protein